ncbi:MAG: RNA methyltransferase [Bacteroidetes bacterium]|nr:RNA methyltransferase [Bacteroidota bacterium]
MISKNKSKFIISLQKKKNRDEENLFVIEGDKLIREFLNADIRLEILAAKPEFINSLPAEKLLLVDETESVSFEELRQLSSLKTPHNALAVVKKQEPKFELSGIFGQLSVALDGVQDPGNLGTIIRAAAWFGISNVICSKDCVDVYNPKVIQSTMGAILHVNVYYTDLSEFLSGAVKKEIHVFGTMLEGDSIYSHKLEKNGVILLGNESKGISNDLIPFITDRIFIPGIGSSKPGIESLNVGMAASIVFSEFARRMNSTIV